MKIGELFMELGFKADTMKLNEFVKSIGELNMSSVLAGSGVAALADMTKKLLEGTGELARDMRFFGTETGMSAQKMQSWSNLAKQLGMDGDQVASTLKHLQTAVTQTKLGNVDQGLMQAYSLLNTYGKAGIDLNQDYFTQIEKMRTGFQNINPDMRRTVANMAGMNDQMINFLLMSDQDWAKRNSQPVMDDAQIQKMKEMNMEWAKLSQELAIIGNKFATDISPVIIETTRALVEMLVEIKNSSFGRLISTVGEGIGKIGELGGIGYTYAKAIDANLYAEALARQYGVPQAADVKDGRANNINIQIHGNSADPNAIADQLVKTLQKELNDTHYSYARSY